MAVQLSAAIEEAVNGALMSGHPITLAAVTLDGAPTVSFRGSVQTEGADALSIWFRNPDSATLAALASNARVVLTWADMAERSFLQFEGRARREDDEVIRDRLYGDMPATERERDPDRVGVAVIVDLDLVRGRVGGEMLQMTR